MAEQGAELGLPLADALQGWAFEYVTSESLAHKTAPGPLPNTVLGVEECSPLRLAEPGRPAELRVSAQKIKAPRDGAQE